MPKSIKISVGGNTFEYKMEAFGSVNRIDYTPTDEDLERIAGMINSGVAQKGVLLIDKASGDTYDLYVSGDKLTMTKVESEG